MNIHNNARLQPKQIPAHNFKSFPPKNHYLIVSEEGLKKD
jgi:hypothetical protein